MTDYPQIPVRRSFSLIVAVETTLPAASFADWTVQAQLRKANNNQPSGLLAELAVYPAESDNPTQLLFLLYHEDTTNWPVGLVELDLAFTHPVNPHVVMTQCRTIEITRSVTRNA